MNKKAVELYNFLLIVFAFFLPFGKKPLAIIIVLLFIAWLFKANYKKIFQWNRLWPGILFASIYFFYLIGLLYSENLHYGFKDLETKLSLFIFPLICFDSDNEKKQLNHVFISFIIGCIVSFIICFYYAWLNYKLYGVTDFLYYSYLSIFLHPGYFSMYLSFGLCMLFYLINEAGNRNKLKAKYVYIAIVPLLLIFQVFLSSKTGLLVSILILSIASIYLTIRKKNVTGLLIIFAIGIFVFVGINKIHVIKDRVKAMTDTFRLAKLNNNTQEGTAIRLLVWKAAIDVITEHPLIGVGTGDVKDKLLEKYKEQHLKFAYDSKLNAHNQYLQTGVTLGVSGLLLLLVILFVPLLISIRKFNYLYAFFILIIFFNFFSESMLETQAGVIFYAFFNSFLFFNGGKKETIISDLDNRKF